MVCCYLRTQSPLVVPLVNRSQRQATLTTRWVGLLFLVDLDYPLTQLSWLAHESSVTNCSLVMHSLHGKSWVQVSSTGGQVDQLLLIRICTVVEWDKFSQTAGL